MLLGNDITGLRLEFAADPATPCAVFKGSMRPGRPLHRGHVLPILVITRTVSMMHCIEDTNLRLARSIQNLPHMRNTIVCFRHVLDTIPDLSALGDEIIVGIDDKKGSDLLFVGDFHVPPK